MNRPRIGFIGIGVMGTPMAGHLAEAGYALAVHDIDPSKAEALAADHPGVVVAETPKAVGELSDVVITMLPSGEYVREVLLGDSGVVGGLRSGGLVLDTSSSEPWLTIETARVLARAGIDMVDAPVSGAQMGARSAQLVFMVGGEDGPVNRVAPLLEAMGKKSFHLGPTGSGHTMKCINNLITAITFMATTEGLVIGKQFGLSPEAMIDVLNVSTGMSWISQTQFKQRIFNRKFDDPFRLELMVKDMGIAMELADRKGLPVPVSALGFDMWKSAERYAGTGSSLSNMVRWVEHAAKSELTAGA